MTKYIFKNLLAIAFLHALGVLVYIMGVGWLMMNGDTIFGTQDNFWGPVMVLMLFVFSALVTSLLVLGRPIWLYLEGKKKKAVKMLSYTVGWMFVLLLIVFGARMISAI
jgi:peptidoglycan/LPS O-acetylase OafA/YrhL